MVTRCVVLRSTLLYCREKDGQGVPKNGVLLDEFTGLCVPYGPLWLSRGGGNSFVSCRPMECRLLEGEELGEVTKTGGCPAEVLARCLHQQVNSLPLGFLVEFEDECAGLLL